MKIEYNNHTIVVEPSGKAAQVAKIFSKEGVLQLEIFTLHGAQSALAGAKRRLFVPSESLFTKFKKIFQS